VAAPRPAHPPEAAPARPVLDLSGPRLRQSLETLVSRAEPDGGVERYVAGIAAKAAMFGDALADGRVARLDEETFLGLAAFMAPVRRRVGETLAAQGFGAIKSAIAALLAGAEDSSDADAVDRRLAAFCAAFPDGPRHRWVRDLAAEVLHYTLPENYPLMARWVWDRKANSGVLREIWYGDIDRTTLDVADGYATFLVLREELSQFLADNGVFRDMLFYVDLLCAQVYADYICAQGGAFLRTDFASEQDPMEYTRRMLGLDGVAPEAGRTRVKLGPGRVFAPPSRG
jgi:hypothetical protein